jgi:hypothetical protein
MPVTDPAMPRYCGMGAAVGCRRSVAPVTIPREDAVYLTARGRIAIAGALAIVAGCAVTGPAPLGVPLTDVWAGEHARLDLTSSGGAIEYDCARGTVSEPVRPDGDGRFAATGFHVREHGGPIREGEAVDSVRALYLGSVVGDRLTLRVVAGGDTLGPFLLRRGGAAQLRKCL